jgi:hypothetical protein
MFIPAVLTLVLLSSAASADAAGITVEGLKDISVTADDLVGDGTHQLNFNDGVFDNGNGTDKIVATAVGDLDGDKVDDGAIVYYENWGGSGNFMTMTVFLWKNGKPVQVGDRSVGDRSIIKGLSIANRVITLDAVVHKLNDPAPTPTLHKVFKYTVRNNKLVGPEPTGLE